MAAIGFLTPLGFAIPETTMKARLGRKLAEFLAKLVIVTPVKVGKPLRAEMYEYASYNGVRCIFLPRGLIDKLLTLRILTSVENCLPAPAAVDMQRVGCELFDNQKLVVDRLMQVLTRERMTAGTATCILNLRAGMGKTFVAAGIIQRLGVRTVYVVPKKPLRVQAMADLRGYFGDDAVGDADQPIKVMVINTALIKAFNGWPDPAPGLVILDEAHMYCSAKRRQIFRRCAPYVVGMSATTEDRGDKFDPIAHRELAPDGIIRAEEIPHFTYEDVKFDCHARIIKYAGPPEHTRALKHEATDRVFTHYMHNQFIGDPYRMRLTLRELVALYDWRGPAGQMHHIYVFAEEVGILRTALEALSAALRDIGRSDIVLGADLSPLELSMFTGGLSEASVNAIAVDARVLFSTYSYGGTGVSISKMSAMLLLTPRMATMKQIIPRCLRRGSDLSIPRVVVDIVDVRTCLVHQHAVRKAALNHYGFVMEKIEVSWEDLAHN